MNFFKCSYDKAENFAKQIDYNNNITPVMIQHYLLQHKNNINDAFTNIKDLYIL